MVRSVFGEGRGGAEERGGAEDRGAAGMLRRGNNGGRATGLCCRLRVDSCENPGEKAQSLLKEELMKGWWAVF